LPTAALNLSQPFRPPVVLCVSPIPPLQANQFTFARATAG
jgi:hypothetical protein